MGVETATQFLSVDALLRDNCGDGENLQKKLQTYERRENGRGI